MTATDVTIIGAGLIGLAIAWRARQRGLTVSVIDHQPGSGASQTAAGMLAPVGEMHYGEETLLNLNLISAHLYPEFVTELGQDSGQKIGYRTCGTMTVAFDNDDNTAIGELYEFAVRNGQSVERLRNRECRQLEPLLTPNVRGGILIDSDHQVDPRQLAAALLTACERKGVVFYRQRAAEILCVSEQVREVRLDNGELLPVAQLVIAAGCWSNTIPGIPKSEQPPIRPVKGQLLHLQAPHNEPFLQRTIRGLVQGTSVYLVPRANGRLIVGATTEERGFDTQVTAEAVYTLLRDARLLVPGVIELGLVEIAAGLRPGSPDNAPMIGASNLAGLMWATGHYRNGVLLTPVTAEAVVQLLCGEQPRPELETFSPTRFNLSGVH